MKARTIIETAFRAMPETYHGFATCKDMLYEDCLKSEKQHRAGRDRSYCHFPASLAAKYFTVKYCLDAVRFPERMPTAADYLSFRHEIFTAYAIVYESLPEFTGWAIRVPMEFDKLDYCELMAD